MFGEKELVGKLKDIGELNRYFAAVTPEEARKFASLLPRVKPTENMEKPFPIIWGGYLLIICRVKKTEDSFSQCESWITQSTGSRNLIGMLGNADMDSNIICGLV